MEKVCYILGAGFSRPLGLPLMSDFLSKAKDMYTRDGIKFGYFMKVFDLFDSFAKIHNHAHTDQTNIEELLSISEMQDFVAQTTNKELVVKFISDVINEYTPVFVNPDMETNLHYFDYVAFVAMLSGIGAEGGSRYSYSVVSLNYDMVIENAFDVLPRIYIDGVAPYRLTGKKFDFDMSKLHGCVSNNTIVPPTWNKTGALTNLSSWRRAYQSLSNANHIRIVGYSLPATDSYLKYLLKICFANMLHLKSITVVCRDNDGSVKARYDEFIKSRNYVFVDGDSSAYLNSFNGGQSSSGNFWCYSAIEDRHDHYLDQIAKRQLQKGRL